MSHNGILVLDFKRQGKTGKGILSAKLAGASVFTDTLNIADADDRAKFITSLCKDRAGIDRAGVMQELETLAGASIDANDDGGQLEQDVLDKRDPLAIARRFIGEQFRHAEHLTIIFADDEMHTFNGVCWESEHATAIRQRLYCYLEPFKVSVKIGDNVSIQPFKPTPREVDAVIDALKAIAYTPAHAPAWLAGNETMPNPAELILAKNGIFAINQDGAQKVCDPTPRLFSVNALTYVINPNASAALKWLAFLDEIFEGDQEQIALLQQWFGYCLTADTRMQKMLLLIGPPRSGKGTIARVLSHVVGTPNVCAPTLAGLGTNFGLWPLIEKTLAIVSDARLSGRTDQAVVTERLLSITGEDSLTIDRKNRDLLTTKLSTRIMVLTNELPKLSDASGALSNRFLISSLRKSFLGNEDINLTERPCTELPEIAAWSIQGLIRLRDEGRFSEPAAADELRRELNDLASLAAAFVRDWCLVAAGESIPMKDLFDAWCLWCAEQGDHRPGTAQTFGRDLRAAFPAIGTRQPNINGERVRKYIGIDLTLAAAETLRVHRDNKSDNRRNRAEWGASHA